MLDGDKLEHQPESGRQLSLRKASSVTSSGNGHTLYKQVVSYQTSDGTCTQDTRTTESFLHIVILKSESIVSDGQMFIWSFV